MAAHLEAVAVDADLTSNSSGFPIPRLPKIVYDTKGSYTTKFRAEVKDKTCISEARFAPSRTHRGDGLLQRAAGRFCQVRPRRSRTLAAAVLDVTVNRKASLTHGWRSRTSRWSRRYSTANLSGSVRYPSLYVSTGKVAASDLEVMSAEVMPRAKAEVSLWITDRFVGRRRPMRGSAKAGDPKIVRGGAKFMGGEINRVE